ncbi:MAG TPA: BamA/TamA family outer membrane protein, partial [Polyangiaceae bacterium]|nr:BamA/TamA family outer membrane protein [Polyangiaceae bacterium]
MALAFFRTFKALCAVLSLAALLCVAPRSARAGDPYLTWWTISTPHFRLHYHSGLEAIAQRAATVAEHAHQALVPQLGWQPSQVTHIVISDDSDSANGLAYALPYNTVKLYVTAPEDMSPLNEYDDWQLELITHEYTHVLQIDNISGLPALLNAVMGKVIAPNQAQPRWILEGLAVAMESEHTNGGRLRSSHFDMYLRADVLEQRLASLDEISNGPRRWPGGELWYLYGARFIAWILDTYGKDTFARVASEYGADVIPWGINRAIRRATGRTYPELYRGWKASLEAEYAAQVAAISERGLREGKRITSGGRIAGMPRFLPAQCARGDQPELVYYRNDGLRRPGFYRVSSAGEDSLSLWTRASGSVASVGTDCSLLFDATAPSRRGYYLSDLFRLRPGMSSESGSDLRRERLTTGERAREPDLSPDGRYVTYVTNNAGTTTLRIAELSPEGQLVNSRRLVASATFDQAFTPRFSPDGKHVAYSVWSRGGFRDIRVVDLENNTFRELTHDRAIDQQPSWSPDGKTLFFSSDRTGVANVYAYDLERDELAQVTNVITGAYMPAVSADGSTLAYVGYTSYGFDLFLMPLDRARYLPALPAPERPDGRPQLSARKWPVTPYSPLGTLGPRSYEIDYGTGTFGNAITVSTRGSDAVGHHAFAAAVTLETEGPEWRAGLDYDYSRLPFVLRTSLFRYVVPRNNYRIAEEARTVTERSYGVSTGIGFYVPGEFDGQSAALSYTVASYTHDTPFGTAADPWSPVPSEPSSGVIATAHLGYAFSNAEGSLYGVSAERGFTLYLGTDFGGPALGSETTLAAFSGALTGYLQMPWQPHHVLALAVSGGGSGGTYPRRGLFSTGGFADVPAFDVYRSGIRQSAFVLRGFEPGQFVGNEYTLLNAEYRFPIAAVDRGVSTLPVFLEQLSGALFADWGGAYDRIDRNDPFQVMHLGVGGELWIQALLGYRVDGTLRLGLAHGFGPE